MNRLSILEIAEFAGAAVSFGHGKTSIDKISTDSRTLKHGELFVALRGENFDAHSFVESVAKAGAAGAIVDSNWTDKTPENFEFMGSREAIAAEKGSLARAVGPEGTVILNADDPFSRSIAPLTSGKVILAGTTEGTVRATEITQSANGTDFTILEGAHRCRAQLPVPGLHMVQTALLGLAAGRVFGLSLEECAAGLAAAPLTKARLQIKEIHGVQFIDDSYNANPDSMKAALRTLVELDTDGKRIAVLGEMRELGDESERGHLEVGETAAALRVDHLIAIGTVAAAIARAAERAGLEKTRAVTSASEAAGILAEIA